MIHEIANGAFEPDRGQRNGGRDGDGFGAFGTLGAGFRGGFRGRFSGDGFAVDAVGIDADEFSRNRRDQGFYDVIGEIDLKNRLFFLLRLAVVVFVVVVSECIILLRFAIPFRPR